MIISAFSEGNKNMIYAFLCLASLLFDQLIAMVLYDALLYFLVAHNHPERPPDGDLSVVQLYGGRHHVPVMQRLAPHHRPQPRRPVQAIAQGSHGLETRLSDKNHYHCHHNHNDPHLMGARGMSDTRVSWPHTRHVSTSPT